MLQYVRVNAASDGDNTIITNADTTKKIVVIGYAVVVNAAGVIQFQDSAGSAAVYASFELPDSGGIAYAGGLDCPAFEVTEGLNLEINCAAGVDALGHLTYTFRSVR